ncbi:putative O-glycosylation ligase, exosortase A system-associated [Roseateles saccharophilus]|uniref:Putative O-glycosylation ligase (Exosortase A-associated) n=1 Tax=Roseateles saccharophilus TaxID=304 RepID=A0A4R3UIW6_ROSSA|nr:putative O-glycosylation ligase, exosortase A system-associated [Roseateles saccharophilus]MDG0835185.1 putative O-glycosylation ligase, exosortase A system-associated [Roseateles saccharophilus]TCU87826.1 putative O-glycosylation ligase (exosortase A-associated) [Roseateles saccharophilus]
MRDIALLVIVGWCFLQAFRHPWIGILGWTWFSIMNPHQLTWTLRTMPFAAVIGGATLIGLFVTKDRRDYSLNRENITLMIFMLWICITLPFSMLFDESFELWKRVMKIDLMILVAMVLLHSKRHMMLLAWVLVISIGFFGVKGGAFTILTGGSYRVWGPENTYIEGNNEVALAIVIVIPLMRFLQMQMQAKWAKTTMTVCMVLMAMAALGSHSRGALLAIAAMALVLWWRGKNKFVGAVTIVVVGVALLSLMPAEWWDRMNTIKSYQQDESALGRINAWGMAWNLAKANFFGGGFMVWTGVIFAIYGPDPNDVHAAHSIYFMVLGEQGFVGLFIFLTLFTMVWFTAGSIRVKARGKPETQWLSDLGGMLQVSLAGYAVGGAFLSLSYWDLPYNLLVLAVIGRRWLERKEWLRERDEPLVYWPEFLKKRFGKKKDLPLP